MIDIRKIDRALSLTQPHAFLMAVDEKKWETRLWTAARTGAIAIHAAKVFPREARELCQKEPFASVLQRHCIRSTDELVTGAIIAVTEIRGCVQTATAVRCFQNQRLRVKNGVSLFGVEPAEFEFEFGNYGPNRHVFVTSGVEQLLVPQPCRGMLSFWRIPDDARRGMMADAQARGSLVVAPQTPWERVLGR